MSVNETPLPEPARSKAFDATRALEQLNLSQVKRFDDASRDTPQLFGYIKDIDQSTGRETSIDELYSNPEFTSRELQIALRLLGESISLSTLALDELRSGDRLASHEATLSLQSRLPELFACRGLGDGYGAIVNSIQLALINRRGQPLDENQLNSLRNLLKELRAQPFIRFDKARKLIKEFELHDFIVEPVTLQFLSNFFDEP